MSPSYTKSNNTNNSTTHDKQPVASGSWINQSVPDFSDESDYASHIQQDMVVQIPRVMPYCGGTPVSNEYIRDVFTNHGVGDVKQCDWKGPFQLTRQDGSVVHTYWEVYVYFNSWTISRNTAKLQGHMKSAEKTMMYYDNDNYWIINECKNPMSNRERLMRDENRKLKCDIFDNNERYNQMVAYYEGLIAQRDQYIATYIDNLDNAREEDELHDLNLPDINSLTSRTERFTLSPPPSPNHSSASVETPTLYRTDSIARDDDYEEDHDFDYPDGPSAQEQYVHMNYTGCL